MGEVCLGEESVWVRRVFGCGESLGEERVCVQYYQSVSELIRHSKFVLCVLHQIMKEEVDCRLLPVFSPTEIN